MSRAIRPTKPVTTIGRGADNDIVLPRDRRVSRHHAELRLYDRRLVLVDLKSKNGTFVNGRAVRRRELAEGDTIRIGGFAFGWSAGRLSVPEKGVLARGPAAPREAAPAARGGRASPLATGVIVAAILVALFGALALRGGQPASKGGYGGGGRGAPGWSGGPTPTPDMTATALTGRVDPVLAGLSTHLEKGGYSWRAGPNDLIELPLSELRKRLGAVVEIVGPASLQWPPKGPSGIRRNLILREAGAPVAAARLARPVRAPSTVDYRSVGTSVRDQGACGSCWAFASIAVFETQLRRARPKLGADLNLSEQRLVSCNDGGCGGYSVAAALQYLVDTGTVRERCSPYRAVDDHALCPTGCPGDTPLRLRAYGKAAPDRVVCSTQEDVRDEAWNSAVTEALAEHGPLAAVMSVPRELFYYKSGIYSFSGYFPDDPWAGCHAVALVGYSQPERYWIIKNSWGAGWGEQGYGRISWDDGYTHVGGRLYWAEVPAATSTSTPTAPERPPYPQPQASETPVPTTPVPPPPQDTDTPIPAPTSTPTATGTSTPPPYPWPWPITDTATPAPTATRTATVTATRPPYPYPGPPHLRSNAATGSGI